MPRLYLLFLALALLHVLLGGLCLVVAQGERKSQALWLWGWGLLCYAAGVILILLGFIPFPVRQVAGNTLICLAALLTAQGLLEYSRYRLAWALGFTGVIISALIMLANHLFHLSLAIDIGTPTVYASLLYLFAALLLIRQPPADARAATRFLIATILITVLVWNARMIVSGLLIGRSFDHSAADLYLSLFSIGQILLVVAVSLSLFWIEARQMEADLIRAAVSDILTGLLNRRGILSRFEQEIERAQRQDQRLALVLLDVDRFKDINDRFGHLAGDSALRTVADRLKSARRTQDVIGRIGGEEFVVLLPNEDIHSACQAAERLRNAVAVTSPGENGPRATVSGGVAIYPDDGTDWDQLFQIADKRLYLAKKEGRNRINIDDV